MMIIITMEKLKIKISEIEGISIKIPTEFTAYSFRKFYKQMIAVGKSMPSNPLGIITNETPERFKMTYWQNKDECFDFLRAWEKGRDAGIKWIKDNRDWDLDKSEISKISSLAATLRTKYRKELEE